MATALIVWQRAAAAFCQKSSSDSPTGMMAHLTNASPTKRASNADPTDRRKSGWGGRGGRIISDWYRFNSVDPDLGRGSKEVIRAFGASFDCVFYSKSSIMCTCTTYNTSTAVPSLNNKSPWSVHAHRS